MAGQFRRPCHDLSDISDSKRYRQWSMPRFQILSLIGGGIRGAFVTSFLYELEQKLGRRISESFDLIAGTSTGGIIAASLAAGMTAEQVHDFYVRYGSQIFTPRPMYRAKGYMRLFYPTVNWIFKRRTGGELDAFLRARYCPDALYRSFDEGFKNATLSDVDFTRLIIPTVNLTKGAPHIFRSAHVVEGVPDQDVLISDMLVAATAAPTYFPHKTIKGEAFADGGLWAADPSMFAIAEAMRIRRDCRRESCDPHFDIDDVQLLSVGTGQANYSLTPPGSDAGMIYWAQHVADVMGTAQVQGVHQPLKFWLGDRYAHVNFQMDKKWPLDGVENIPQLFAVGKRRANEEFDRIDEHFFSHQRQQFQPYTAEDFTASCGKC